MSSETLSTNWPNPASLKTAAAKRFVEFCEKNPPAAPTDAEGQKLYQDAVSLVLKRLEQGLPSGGPQQ